jgi:hypothetical protein
MSTLGAALRPLRGTPGGLLRATLPLHPAAGSAWAEPERARACARACACACACLS